MDLTTKWIYLLYVVAGFSFMQIWEDNNRDACTHAQNVSSTRMALINGGIDNIVFKLGTQFSRNIELVMSKWVCVCVYWWTTCSVHLKWWELFQCREDLATPDATKCHISMCDAIRVSVSVWLCVSVSYGWWQSSILSTMTTDKNTQ